MKDATATPLEQVRVGVQVDRPVTRHEARFGITSFIYSARRPFHPGRLDDLFLEPFFIIPDFMDDKGPLTFDVLQWPMGGESVPN